MKVKLEDAKKTTSNEFVSYFIFTESTESAIDWDLIKAPYFEPAPLTSYEVFSNDAINIELGEPIDPQGSEV